MSPTEVRPISSTDHLRFVDRLGASFLQTPAWGQVKRGWSSESIGWFRSGELVGVGLVLYRHLPIGKRSLAYLPEGPVLDWTDPDVRGMLRELRAFLARRRAFAIRIGPPVVTRTWTAGTVKKAMAELNVRRLGDVPPDSRSEVGESIARLLREEGWRRQGGGEGFSAGQPQYVFQLPLTGRDEASLLSGMNQQWRRNIKKAAQAGVEVSVGTRADLPAFHELYAETARRDGFTPRPLSYFQHMLDNMTAESADRITLYLARHEGDLVAATTAVKVGRHVWYSYGASSTAKREVRGSNAVQWQMMRDALASGADVYDMRGITDTLEADDPHVGLIQFKVGTGGTAVEYAGEWDLPLNRVLYKGFELYLRRRQGGIAE